MALLSKTLLIYSVVIMCPDIHNCRKKGENSLYVEVFGEADTCKRKEIEEL
jgi:hypothetical protein